jgi:hypothetical protein
MPAQSLPTRKRGAGILGLAIAGIQTIWIPAFAGMMRLGDGVAVKYITAAANGGTQ